MGGKRGINGESDHDEVRLKPPCLSCAVAGGKQPLFSLGLRKQTAYAAISRQGQLSMPV